LTLTLLCARARDDLFGIAAVTEASRRSRCRRGEVTDYVYACRSRKQSDATGESLAPTLRACNKIATYRRGEIEKKRRNVLHAQHDIPMMRPTTVFTTDASVCLTRVCDSAHHAAHRRSRCSVSIQRRNPSVRSDLVASAAPRARASRRELGTTKDTVPREAERIAGRLSGHLPLARN